MQLVFIAKGKENEIHKEMTYRYNAIDESLEFAELLLQTEIELLGGEGIWLLVKSYLRFAYTSSKVTVHYVWRQFN